MLRCRPANLPDNSPEPYHRQPLSNHIMAPARPRVLTGLQLPELVQHLLEHDSPSSVLVICTSKDVFVEQLHATCLDSDINNTNDEPPTDTTDTTDPEPKEPSKPEHHPLLKQPTLHQLATSRKIKLVFCPELVHLRAYLSTLAIPTWVTIFHRHCSRRVFSRHRRPAKLIAEKMPDGTET